VTRQSILITGGTGSFGKKAAKTILERLNPERLIIFSRDELKQFEQSQDFTSPNMRFFLGDVRDYSRLTQAFRGVDVVIHAAALKQVPAAEYNPIEFVKTNINGAENVIRAAIDCGVEKVIALSTDKAANPINLYGATKLVSDKLFVSANNIVGRGPTKFSVVRYGNVIGSRGSIVPLFRKLIKAGHPYLPITHNDMTRFLITLDQGVDFVLTSLNEMDGGEVFVPKIPSAKITDLASAIDPNIPQKIIGIRPGEKIHEVMCPRDDAHITYEKSDCYVVRAPLGTSMNVSDKLNIEEQLVPPDFQYDSETNQHQMSVDQISGLLEDLGL
jgi:UDP-N-acetylglucosamine 4,6-dehydratase/5-epimerase